MALDLTALVIGGTAINAAVDGMRIHSGARGATGTNNRVGSLVSVTGTVASDGDIIWSNVTFTGLTPFQTVAELSYYSGSTYRGGGAPSGGDTAANAAGVYIVGEWRESAAAT